MFVLLYTSKIVLTIKTAEAQSADLTLPNKTKLRAELTDIESDKDSTKYFDTKGWRYIQRDMGILNARIKQAQLE